MLSVPESLAKHHQIDRFCSNTPSLDDWLHRRANQNQTTGASRAFVTCDELRVVGYYALASSSVASAAAPPGRFQPNMPDPVPVVVLARLAVDQEYQGKDIGRALFQDAARRVLYAAEAIGIRGLIVHTVSEKAKAFYLRLGLDPSPLDPMTLLVTIADLRAALA